MNACAGAKDGDVQDPCGDKAPKWYLNQAKSCPKGHVCGFAVAGTGNITTAELKSQAFAAANLAKSLEQRIALSMKGGIQDFDGAEDFEEDVLDTKIGLQVKRVLTNTVVHKQEYRSCGGKNWYWVIVKKNIKGEDWNSLFRQIAREANLPERTQEYINEVDDWYERTFNE
jgi:hypothetical protein